MHTPYVWAAHNQTAAKDMLIVITPSLLQLYLKISNDQIDNTEKHEYIRYNETKNSLLRTPKFHIQQLEILKWHLRICKITGKHQPN